MVMLDHISMTNFDFWPVSKFDHNFYDITVIFSEQHSVSKLTFLKSWFKKKESGEA